MRIRSVLLALVTAAASASAAPAPTGGTAAAKAANARGMRLMTAKKYKDAMAEFGKAIAADRDFVLAHYNLACAGSRAHDAGVAEEQLFWIESAAAWDSTAAKAAAKATSDPDLQWFLSSKLAEALMIADPRNAVQDLLDVDDHKEAPAALAKLLASAPGKHDDQCDSTGEQAHVYGYAFSTDFWVVASLRDGVALVKGGKLLSRTEPLGCTLPGASQDRVLSVGTVEIQHDVDRDGDELVIVSYGNGGRRSFTDNVAVFDTKGDTQIERVFDATVSSSDDSSPGTLELTAVGDIVLGQPGAKQKRVFHWDPATFRYVEAKR